MDGGDRVGARADDPLEVVVRVPHDPRVQAQARHDHEALPAAVPGAAHDVDGPGGPVQGQAQRLVGVQRDRQVAGEQVAGARGQQGDGRAGVRELGAHRPDRPVAAGDHDQVHPGPQGAAGGPVTGVVGRGLQPQAGAPAGPLHLRPDAAAQQGQVVELDGVEDDGGALVHDPARSRQARPAGSEGMVDPAEGEREVGDGAAQKEGADDVADVDQAHVPLGDGNEQDRARADGRPAHNGRGAPAAGADEGDQHPGAQDHGGDVAGRVGAAEVGDRVGEGGGRARHVQGEGQDQLAGRAQGPDAEGEREAPHALPEGEDDGADDDDEDEHGVGQQAEGLGELAAGGARRQGGGPQAGVQVVQRAAQDEPGPDGEGQGEDDRQAQFGAGGAGVMSWCGHRAS